MTSRRGAAGGLRDREAGPADRARRQHPYARIASSESEQAREVAGRRLGPLEGDMSERESRTAARYLLMSMSKEKRAEYDF